MNKKVLLAMPTHFEIHKMLIENFKHNGYEVFSICTDESYTYKNFFERLVNFFKKTFLRDKTFKKNLYYQSLSEKVLPKIEHFPDNYFDFSFFIRADVYSLEIIKRVNQIAKKNVAYQWDGINRFPLIFERINLFDKFYVFENSDYDTYSKTYSNLYLTQNFCSDLDQSDVIKTQDVYYVGSYNKYRINNLMLMYKSLKKLPLNIKIEVNCRKKRIIKKYANKDISFFSEGRSYLETQEKVKTAKILLDVRVKEHSGLSFRFFEAIKYKCKIITDNKSIKDYDFYHPDNFFILHQDNLDDLEEFVKSDYHEISEEIYQKYAFKNWIRQIFS